MQRLKERYVVFGKKCQSEEKDLCIFSSLIKQTDLKYNTIHTVLVNVADPATSLASFSVVGPLRAAGLYTCRKKLILISLYYYLINIIKILSFSSFNVVFHLKKNPNKPPDLLRRANPDLVCKTKQHHWFGNTEV